MKAVDPVIATLILIAIAVIAGVFVLRQFLAMAGGATAQQYLQIADLYIVRRDNPDGTFDIEITIGVKNAGDKRITVKQIIVPDAQWESDPIDVNLGPGDTWQGTFLILDDKPWTEVKNNVEYRWGEVWRRGTEHVIIVKYMVIGDPQPREISQKGVVT